MGQIQVIKCKGGKIFAACRVPECYEETSWMRDIRSYVKAGCTVEIIESGKSNPMEKCECGAKSSCCKLMESTQASIPF
jgi:hypothetical protein